ncbi:MAG: ferritin-like domain-containing protein [Methylococcales bacterium]
MNNIFECAEVCLQLGQIDDVVVNTHQVWQSFLTKQLNFTANTPVLPISKVIFPARPQLMKPRDMPKRKLTSAQGLAAFFHAIAHVEFVAIYLAWDIIYRFRGMPEQFYCDWLRVADEEAQHFELLRAHLCTMHTDYGELPAHAGLWEHATDTADDLLARLALVPRCMEARGLDVTPALIEKFTALGDAHSAAILTRILTDEVGHVQLGSTWFKYVCEQQGFAYQVKYRELIDQYYKGGKPKGPFNREMRIIAGFSNDEVDWLETQ